MKILYICGSHRKHSNTESLLNRAKNLTGGKLIQLLDYEIKYCRECWACINKGECIIQDDFSQIIVPELLIADALVIGSPVFFNNVSGTLKNFMDRTWCLRKKLKNKIGGIIVVGRAYGHQGAIDAISSFFLKHEMIPANRGVSAMAHEKGDVKNDEVAIKATEQLAQRIMELNHLLNN